MAERPRFRVNELSFIGHSLCQPGDEVFYTPSDGGGVSANLKPLNDAAQELVDAQGRDHPDKTIHLGKKAKAAKQAEADQLETEQESDNGPLPKGVKPKGDTRSRVKAAKAPGKAAQTDAAPSVDDDDDDGDVA